MENELFNREFESYSKEGSNLSKNFNNLVEDFIKDACNKFNTIDVEVILKNVISQKCLFNRARKSLNKRIKEVDKTK